jgi:multimeric flavodoxin WrbA
MRIVVINGSPKGKDGNTNVIVSSFLKGAQEAGAETINLFLADKEIKHCKGCHTCWTRGPMQCVITDQMTEVLAQMGGADIIVFASPVYFGNISGMLKTFMDRMTMIGSPHSSNDAKKNDQQSGSMAVKVPKLMMISSCGFSDRTEFDVTSLWIKKIANKMNMELAAEIYATRGKDLNAPPESLSPEVLNYLQQVENAGKEIATDRKERFTYPSSPLILSSSC